MNTLDRFDDDNEYLNHLQETTGTRLRLPKCYAYSTPADYAVVEKTASGLRCKLPLHTRDETLASLAYFLEYGGTLEPPLQKVAASNINDALVLFGLRAHTELEKTAAMVLGFSDAEGNDINANEDELLRQLFPGIDVDSNALQGHFDSSSPRGKRRIAWMAKEASVSLAGADAYLETEYGTDVEVHLDIRGRYCDDMRLTDDLREKVARLRPEAAVKLIEEFDKEHGLQRLYVTHGLATPQETVYSREMEKVAMDFGVVELGDRTLGRDEFGEFITNSYDKIKATFGESVAGALRDNPVEVFESLPNPHKDAIATLHD